MRIKKWLSFRRFLLNLRFRNLSTLEKFRKIILLVLLCFCIWSLNIGLSKGLLGDRVISISNDIVVTSLMGEAVVSDAPEGDKEILMVSGDNPVQSPSIEMTQLIAEAFPEVKNEALRVATCESGLNPSRIGDQHLSFIHEGELLGESYGLFQIRSGGKEKNGIIWSRAKKMGLTVEEFKQKMLIPEENIKMAREIYEKQKWFPWTCKKELI